MKNIQFVALVCLSACSVGLSSCANYPHDTASAVVTAPYPGKGEPKKCKPYADALYNALKKKHIPAWKICYLGGTSGMDSFLHSMVVYKDAGAYWYVDNTFPFPTKAWGSTPLEWAKDRSNLDTLDSAPVNIFSRPAAYCVVLKVESAEKPARKTPHFITRKPLKRKPIILYAIH